MRWRGQPQSESSKATSSWGSSVRSAWICAQRAVKRWDCGDQSTVPCRRSCSLWRRLARRRRGQLRWGWGDSRLGPIGAQGRTLAKRWLY